LYGAPRRGRLVRLPAAELLNASERALGAVPRWLWLALCMSLGAQLAWQTARQPQAPAAEDLPPAPRAQALRLAAFGEPQATARAALLAKHRLADLALARRYAAAIERYTTSA